MTPRLARGVRTGRLRASPSRSHVRSEVEALLAGCDLSWAAGTDVLVASVGAGSTALARAVAKECAAVIGHMASPERIGVVGSVVQVRDYFLARRAATQAGMRPLAEISLRSCCLADGVSVATDWLLPTALVVVGEWHSNLFLGHSVVLDALPLLLNPTRSASNTLVLEHVYEAHRLLRPDLCLACARRAGPGGTALIAGESDIDVEAATATLSGQNPNSLPQLSFIARHEAGTTPVLASGREGAARRTALSGASRITEAWADARRLPRNSRRILGAAARRLPGRVE